MKKIVAFMVFGGWLCSSYGQTIFQKYYGFGSEIGHQIFECDSGFITLGTKNFTNSSDAIVSKLDYYGNVIWSKTYGGNWSDDAFGIDKTYDGGYIIAGYSNSFGGITPNEFDHVLLFRIDISGNLQWTRIIDIGGVDVAYSVKETFDKGFILTGTATIGFANTFVIKTDSVGIIEWAKEYGSSSNSFDAGRSVIQLRDSNYAVLAMSNEIGPSDTAAVLYIINPTGIALSAHIYRIMNTSVGDDITYAYGLCQDQNGDILLAGGSGGNFQNLFYAYSPFLLKTDSSGNYISGKIYSLNSGPCHAYSVNEKTGGGGYILGGTMGSHYPFMIETDASLNTNWCYYYGNFGPQNANSGFGFNAIHVSDGGYALTGYRTFSNPGIFTTVVKTDAAGQSGCNQSVPIFGGSASNFTYTSTTGSTSTLGNAFQLQITLPTSNLVLPENVTCIYTSNSELNQSAFSIYPNPVCDKLHVRFNQHHPLKVDIEIYDITGRLVQQETFDSGEFEFNVNTLESGLYFMAIDKNHSIVHRFIKQ